MSENDERDDRDVTISVGETSERDDDVEMPVIELLTGRGFVTGKSGSGKSNTASVVAERLLDRELGLLIVDVDGEYYGLKEQYEVLHAGADEECDIQVSPEHAGKLAELALEGSVPVILDVSGYLDEDVADELVCNVARQLFAKEKKLKRPFLLVVEECHEYIPEGGGLSETGKMLVKVGKRGRKHGLGIVGISQRPANVKKDFITQCDWLVWHRLTWRNDTKVVKRILGSEYADAVEDLDDGEAFLMTDWAENVRRVQFHRKETFDAGATPGLEDVERPDLKSVSDDLVDDLRNISEERERRESELADLRQELDRKEAKIEELKRELEEAKDLKRMADRFSQALLSRAEAPYRDPSGGSGGTVAGPGYPGTDTVEAELPDFADEDAIDVGAPVDASGTGPAAVETGAGSGRPDPEGADPAGEVATGERPGANGEPTVDAGSDVSDEAGGNHEASGSDEAGESDGSSTADGSRRPTGATDDEVARAVASVRAREAAERAGATDASATNGQSTADGTTASEGGAAGVVPGVFGPDSIVDADLSTDDGTDDASDGSAVDRGADEGGAAAADEGAEILDESGGPERPDVDAFGTRAAVVDGLKRRLGALDPLPRRMLDHYREVGVADPVSAHVAAGGDGDETLAYARNRPLRRAGFVDHAGQGQYEYALPGLIREACADRLDDDELASVLAELEAEP
jgi:hypothetical protein